MAAIAIALGLSWADALADPNVNKVGEDSVKAALIALGKEYRRLDDEWIRAAADGAAESDVEISDEEWLKRDRERDSKDPSPDTRLLPRFLALAEDHPESPFAFDALAFVIGRGGPSTGDVEGEPWRLKERAIDEVLEHHLNDPRIFIVFDLLSRSLPSRKTEQLLRTAFASGREPKTRAAAGLSLARHLETLGKAHSRSRQLADKERLLNFERFWTIVVTPYLEARFPDDQFETSAKIERILHTILEEYADIEAKRWEVSGPHNVFVDLKPFDRPKTYGELARAMLFSLNNIVPGKKAPEIEGFDSEGNRFRLSDYEGKVVLLTFSANWCGPCVQLYPLQRDLVEKFRDERFVLLSVSRDEKVDTLRASRASGKITWRCWWDGLDGPISAACRPRGIPTLILLDRQHIIQDVPLNRFTPQEDFEKAITHLLNQDECAHPFRAPANDTSAESVQ